jgi:LytR cell envelope-related transcriptional attenuator/LytR_cpsA_psr family
VQPAPASLEPAAGMPAGTNLTDADPLTGTDNSGFSAYLDGYSRKKGGAQYLHLGAAQSLAFVRSRDTLPGVDLGRTKRQQAVLDYVIYELKHEGVFSVTGKLDSLLSTASQYLITDSTFNLLDFATDMRGLTGSNVSFTTLPFTPENNVTVPGYTTPQDVNIIDVPGIQRLVLSAFDPQKAAAAASAAPAGVTVDVYNGNPGANGLADQVSQALAALGYKAGKVTNSSAQSQAVEPGTQIFYGPGASAGAQQIALQFGAAATALSTLPAGHVEVLIGSTVTQVPAGIASSSTSAATQAVGAQVIGVRSAASQAATPTPSSTAGTGSSTGGSVTVAPNAPYGIPCVY